MAAGVGDQYGPYRTVEDDFDAATCRRVEDLVRRGTPPSDPAVARLAWYYVDRRDRHLRWTWWANTGAALCWVALAAWWTARAWTAGHMSSVIVSLVLVAVWAVLGVWRLPAWNRQERARLQRAREVLAAVGH